VAKAKVSAAFPEIAPEQLQSHFTRVKEIIQAEELWERVPESAREFSPENLEGLVKFAYFAGFIDLGEVRRFLFLDKGEVRRRLTTWYAEIREKGCWLC
jgi:hypothetical protein